MQNTSPGPEGKEREGRRGEGKQRTEYECRHFPGWPIVCMVSSLGEVETCLTEPTSPGVCRTPFTASGAQPLTTLSAIRGRGAAPPAALAETASALWLLPQTQGFSWMECPAGKPFCLQSAVLEFKRTSLCDLDEAESNSLYSKL